MKKLILVLIMSSLLPCYVRRVRDEGNLLYFIELLPSPSVPLPQAGEGRKALYQTFGHVIIAPANKYSNPVDF